jgi:hypothetical protein
LRDFPNKGPGEAANKEGLVEGHFCVYCLASGGNFVARVHPPQPLQHPARSAHALHRADDIVAHFVSNHLARFRNSAPPVPPFNALFSSERDGDAQHNGGEFLQKVAPPVNGFWLVNVHQSVLISSNSIIHVRFTQKRSFRPGQLNVCFARIADIQAAC